MKKCFLFSMTLILLFSFPRPSQAFVFQSTLSPGARGAEVVWLQKVLNAIGKTIAFFPQAGSPGHETDYYGPLTVVAVKSLQCEEGIVCSGTPKTTGFGLVGPKTRSLLNSLLARLKGLFSNISPKFPFPQVAGEKITAGLVGYWTFDEGAGSTAADSSGSGNAGTVSGGATRTAGKIGSGALVFDGVDDYVNLGNVAAFNFGAGDFSLAGWVKIADDSQNRAIISKRSVCNHESFWNAIVGGGSKSVFLEVDQDSAGANYTKAQGVINVRDSAWRHFAVVRSGATLSVYVDGALDKSAAGAGIANLSNAANVLIGKYPCGSQYFKGELDDIRIYNRVISTADIAALVALGTTPTEPPPSPSPVNGSCGATLNTCSAGAFADVTDSATQYLWNCLGSNGGATASCSITIPITVPVSAGPLKASSANPRYFADPSGKIVYLTGSHTWNNLQDFGNWAAFDYAGYLNFLKSKGHNVIRLWQIDEPNLNYFNNAGSVNPLPFAKSGTKYDLSILNQTFFDRLKARVQTARDQGIYVIVMFFDGFWVNGQPAQWAAHYYNPANNVNGLTTTLNQVYTLNSPQLLAYQEAYIKKVIDTVNEFDNVLYEIGNEMPSQSKDFQYHMISLIKSYEAGKPKQHPVGMTAFDYTTMETQKLPGNDWLAQSPADWISPSGGGSLYTTYSTNPPVATGGKVIILDTDHIGASGDWTYWAWESFTRGHNPIYMDPYDLASRPADTGLRAAMGHTKIYADKMNIAAMTPRGDLTSTGFALANPGEEYLVYQKANSGFTVNLPAAVYQAEWFDPVRGIVTATESVTAGGGNQSFTFPAGYASGAVLYLKKSASAPPSATYTLSVGKSGTGSGTVAHVPAAGGTQVINCGTDCSESLNAGTSLVLSATPAAGSTFAGWSQGCTGTGTCTVTLGANTTVTATFNTTSTPPPPGSGKTINALSCSQPDVQNAINSAVSGDTVLVPAGTCTWGSEVNLPNGKDIILKGAGVGKTVITGAGWRAFYIGSGSRVTGFEIYQNAGKEIIKVESPNSARFRIDHNKFEGPAADRKFIEIDGSATRGGQPFGVIDNNSIRNVKTNLIGSSPLYAWEMWARPLDLGTDRYVYVEDNVFDYTAGFNPIDSNWGTRAVFRYNDVTNGWVEVHGNQGNTSRGNRAWEIYGNTFVYTPIYTAWQPVHFIRSGTGVVYDNVATSNNPSLSEYLGVDVRRAAAGISLGGNFRDGNEPIPSQGTGSHTGGNGTSVLSDSTKNWAPESLTKGRVLGTAYGNFNPAFWLYNLTSGAYGVISSHTGSTVTASLGGGSRTTWNTGDKYKITGGYYSRDQIGRSTDAYLGSETNWPPQALDPAYFWNNTMNGKLMTVSIRNGTTFWAKEGRDFFVNVGPKPGYTPYTYPHPLRTSGFLADTQTSPQPPAPASYTLTVTKSGTGTGTVTGAGIACGTDCSETLVSGTSVTLTAAPAAGSTFAGWSGGGCAGTGTCTVLLDADKNVTATFALEPVNGACGLAAKSYSATEAFPAGAYCAAGTPSPLSPLNPVAGSSSSWNCVGSNGGWTALCTASRQPLVINGACGLIQDTCVSGSFADLSDSSTNYLWSCVGSDGGATASCSIVKPAFTLTVQKVGTGSGIVTSNPAAINCGLDCTESMVSGSSISLSAAADDGSAFAGWSGACFGAGSCAILADSVKIVTAAFTDIAAPLISAINESVPTYNSITISWFTNELADSQVEYGLSAAYGTLSALNSEMTKSHSLSLTGLEPSSLYYYRLISLDAFGNAARSESRTFSTTGAPAIIDVAPPKILGITVSDVTSSGATISWETDEPTIGSVEYGQNSTYGSTESDSALKTSHRITLANLARKTTYHFRIKVQDQAANFNVSGDQTFTTLSRLSKPPRISKLSAANGSVILSWENPDYEFFDHVNIYRRTDWFPKANEIGSKAAVAFTPTWTDADVKPATTYYYTLYVADDQNVLSDAEPIAFTTPAQAVQSAAASPGGGTTFIVTLPEPLATSTPAINAATSTPVLTLAIPAQATTTQTSLTSFPITNSRLYERLKGRIILRVKSHGQAYYISPKEKIMHYLGRPADAFSIMRSQVLGISDVNLAKIRLNLELVGGSDTDQDGLPDDLEISLGTDPNQSDTDADGFSDKAEIMNDYPPLLEKNQRTIFDNALALRLKGRILLQTERRGQAYYLNPLDGQRYFLSRPRDAFNIMRQLGLGITDQDYQALGGK